MNASNPSPPDLFQKLFEGMEDACAICRMEEILGYSEAELLNLTFLDITHSDHVEADLASVMELASGAVKEIQKEKRYLHRSERVVWVFKRMVSLPGAPARHHREAPAPPDPRPRPGRAPAPAPLPALGHVLLVDDDEDVRILMVRMLRKAGVAQVKGAAGGEEALALLGSGPVPDLVILDQNMPGMSGVQLMGLIRDLHPGLPILFSSGQPDIEDWECLKVQGVAVISKPFTIEEIQAKLADFGQNR